ncbi:MAG TPA: diguanylate cyclase, partial [Paracoccaceae bacterium]|nr:diguanylate cyclase [Paracoccaceae bacterium]
EFFVAMPDIDHEQAAAAAERIRGAVEGRPFEVTGTKDGLRVTVSIGVAIGTAEDGDPETIIRRADLALFRSKNAGRNRVSFCAEAA